MFLAYRCVVSLGPERKNAEAVVNESTISKRVAGKVKKFAPGLFFGSVFVGACIWRGITQDSAAVDLLVISVALISTLLIAHQRLPLQNIIGLVVTIFVFWWATLAIAKMSGFFFSPPVYRFRFFREYEFGLFWATGLINARGIAKLFLHRWPKGANRGLWLIGLSGLLIAIEDAIARKNLGFFAAKFLFATLFFVAATPWFLDKKRVEEKPDFQPLFVTILLLLW